MWPAMEKPLRTAIEARLKQAEDVVASWRLTMSDLKHDIRDIFTQVRNRTAMYRQSLRPVPPSVGLGLLFILSVVAGIGLKTWAKTTITIGHEDYRLIPVERLSSLNEFREQALAEGSSLTIETRTEHPSCSDSTGALAP